LGKAYTYLRFCKFIVKNDAHVYESG